MNEKIRTEIHCHECNQYCRVELDATLNGNHVVNCPKCKHKHYRVIKDGVVTGERYASSNGNTYNATYVSAPTQNSTMFQSYQAQNNYIGTAWSQASSTASTTWYG